MPPTSTRHTAMNLPHTASLLEQQQHRSQYAPTLGPQLRTKLSTGANTQTSRQGVERCLGWGWGRKLHGEKPNKGLWVQAAQTQGQGKSLSHMQSQPFRPDLVQPSRAAPGSQRCACAHTRLAQLASSTTNCPAKAQHQYRPPALLGVLPPGKPWVESHWMEGSCLLQGVLGQGFSSKKDCQRCLGS